MSIGYKNPPSRKGAKWTQESKDRLSKAKTGIKRGAMPEERKARISATLKSKYASGELKVIISEERIAAMKSRRGKLSPAWKGGKTREKELIRKRKAWKDMRTAVFERDNYTCQNCLVRGGVIEPHHIKEVANYPELVYVLNNVITLCHECHKKTDNYGNKKRKEV